MGRRFRGRDGVIMAAMVATEASNVGMNTLFKAASSKGMSSYTFLFYSYAFGSLLLLPSLFSSHRSRSLPPLRILGKTGLLGVIGSIYLVTGYTGIKFSSPTLASAMSNVTPAFTFILAVIFGMEKISMGRESSVAKVVGTAVSIGGALVAALYNGPPIFSVESQPSISLSPSPENSNWVAGGGLLAIKDTVISLSYILQAQIMSEQQSPFTVTFIYSAIVCISSVLVSVIAERNNPSAWSIRFDITSICIITAGILNPGYYVIHLWAVRYKGPVYIAIFRPLSIVIAVVMGAIFLGDSLYLGSLIGGTLISMGFYSVMWGKAKEETSETDETSSPPCLDSKKAPLLSNLKDKTLHI
ncbi:PREDICTED: WAT1-related protein At3g28130-like [Tarenaya hassleriana]|uniref:WAT1-related protein At3g28130-like n=1 Tax=Tarenaya hassleriana TaxID=28532 RepID=UPI00053C6460|nr:PREDICTED: WAT1-related protein At3g28130-like [Tarenaya hassleriana]